MQQRSAEGVKVLGISVNEKPGAEYPSHMFLDSTGNVTCVALGMLKRGQMVNEIAVAISLKGCLGSGACGYKVS